MRKFYLHSLNTVERLHSRFLQQVPDYKAFVKVTLVERRRFHTAVQVFKVLYQPAVSALSVRPGYSVNYYYYY